MNLINIADLRDSDDPHGRTYRQVNLAKQHTIPVGTLVEVELGARLFVVYHARDCDGTPLYSLSPDPSDTEKQHGGFYNRTWLNGYSEESLRPITVSDDDYT